MRLWVWAVRAMLAFGVLMVAARYMTADPNTRGMTDHIAPQLLLDTQFSTMQSENARLRRTIEKLQNQHNRPIIEQLRDPPAQPSRFQRCLSPTNFSTPRDPTGVVAIAVQCDPGPKVGPSCGTMRQLKRSWDANDRFFFKPQNLSVLLVPLGGTERPMLVRKLRLRAAARAPWEGGELKDGVRSMRMRDLDGVLTTLFAYRSLRGTPVLIALTSYPRPPFVLADPSWLSVQDRIEPPRCRAPLAYVEGTRFYVHRLFSMRVLQWFDYWVKLDTDAAHFRGWPFHIMTDMNLRGSVLGHTAMYPRMVGASCVVALNQAVAAWLNTTEFGAACSAGKPNYEQETDRYSTSLLVGRVDFWTGDVPRSLGQFLAEWPRGFWSHRWGDQVFWHKALGVAVTDFEAAVADYSEFKYSAAHGTPKGEFWDAGVIKHLDPLSTRATFVDRLKNPAFKNWFENHVEHDLPRQVGVAPGLDKPYALNPTTR